MNNDLRKKKKLVPKPNSHSRSISWSEGVPKNLWTLLKPLHRCISMFLSTCQCHDSLRMQKQAPVPTYSFIHLTNSNWALTTSPRSQQWNITLCFFTGTLERIKKTLSLVENLKSCLTECRRRSRQQRIRWSESITHSMDMSLSKLREMMAREALHVAVRGIAKRQTWISDWTTTTATTNLIEWPRNKPSDQGKGARQPMAN